MVKCEYALTMYGSNGNTPVTSSLTPFKVDGLIFGQDRGMSITASMVPSPSRRAAVVLPDDGRFVDILQKRHGNM